MVPVAKGHLRLAHLAPEPDQAICQAKRQCEQKYSSAIPGIGFGEAVNCIADENNGRSRDHCMDDSD